MNKIENKNKIKKINKYNSWFFKTNRINQSLASFNQKKRHTIHMLDILELLSKSYEQKYDD